MLLHKNHYLDNKFSIFWKQLNILNVTSLKTTHKLNKTTHKYTKDGNVTSINTHWIFTKNTKQGVKISIVIPGYCFTITYLISFNSGWPLNKEITWDLFWVRPNTTHVNTTWSKGVVSEFRRQGYGWRLSKMAGNLIWVNV